MNRPRRQRLFQSPPAPIGYKVERGTEVTLISGSKVKSWTALTSFYDYRTRRRVDVPRLYTRRHNADAMAKRYREYAGFGPDIRVVPMFEAVANTVAQPPRNLPHLMMPKAVSVPMDDDA